MTLCTRPRRDCQKKNCWIVIITCRLFPERACEIGDDRNNHLSHPAFLLLSTITMRRREIQNEHSYLLVLIVPKRKLQEKDGEIEVRTRVFSNTCRIQCAGCASEDKDLACRWSVKFLGPGSLTTTKCMTVNLQNLLHLIDRLSPALVVVSTE